MGCGLTKIEKNDEIKSNESKPKKLNQPANKPNQNVPKKGNNLVKSIASETVSAGAQTAKKQGVNAIKKFLENKEDEDDIDKKMSDKEKKNEEDVERDEDRAQTDNDQNSGKENEEQSNDGGQEDGGSD